MSQSVSGPQVVVAPWFNDLRRAVADARVDKREVLARITPHARQLQENPGYREAIDRLLAGTYRDSKNQAVKVTAGAKKAIEALLGEPAPVQGHRFVSFLVRQASTLNDGGSIIVDGQFNRSVSGRVVYDGAIGSPSRGKFFLTTQVFNQAATTTTELTGLDLVAFGHALERAIGSGNPSAGILQRMIDRIGG